MVAVRAAAAVGRFRRRLVVALAVVTLVRSASLACTGTACMQIWSTEDGGGALTVHWDYRNPVQTYLSLCVSGQCLYSANDPGFMAPPADTAPSGLFRLSDGTNVSIEIVSIDGGFTMNVNGTNLTKSGDTQLLGAMPTIHVHPIWKIVVPQDQFGTYRVSYKLTTTTPGYSESAVYTQAITNVQPTDPTPTPTPTVAPSSGCPGDCDGNTQVAVNELVVCVNIALGNSDLSTCAACDADDDKKVAVNELVSAVDASLNGCPPPPTVTFDELQTTIFTPTCATQFCHDAASHNENLVLVAGEAYGNLVNVQSIESNLLRVAPGDPANSFLLVKLTGPPLGQGSQMPLGLPPLSSKQIEMVRNWILQGAKP